MQIIHVHMRDPSYLFSTIPNVKPFRGRWLPCSLVFQPCSPSSLGLLCDFLLTTGPRDFHSVGLIP